MIDDSESKSLPTFVGDRIVVEGGILFGFFDKVSPCLNERAIPDLPKLLRKAHESKLGALLVFVHYTQSLCHQLELLTRAKPDFVKQIACTFSDWPIVYSLYGAGKN